MYTNAFQHTKNKGNLFSEVKVVGPLLAGLPLKLRAFYLKKQDIPGLLLKFCKQRNFAIFGPDVFDTFYFGCFMLYFVVVRKYVFINFRDRFYWFKDLWRIKSVKNILGPFEIA